MREEQTVEITVAHDGPIGAFELGHFLYLFRSAYAVALKSELGFAENDARLGRFDLRPYMWQSLPAYWYMDLGQDELQFIEIDKHSPLKLLARTTAACTVALTLAVILSGGTADLKNGKFVLPPLGTGIAHLREALGAPGPNGGPTQNRRPGPR